MSELLNKVERVRIHYKSLLEKHNQYQSQVISAQAKMDEILKEQDLIERTIVALKQVKPLLSASSIKQCETLANSAISSVFGFPYTVEYNVESQRFILNKGDYSTDLADAEGGGLVTVISFVFNLYLLVKLGKRRFLAFDEAFYAVSDKYIGTFISFVGQVCKDLDVDLLLISHDERVTLDMVDSAYLIENGTSKRIK